MIFDVVFLQAYVFWFLIPIFLLTTVLYWKKYRDQQKVFKDRWFSMYLHDARLPSGISHTGRALATLVIASLLIIVAAEPEKRSVNYEPVYSVRITFLLDVSRSMVNAQDVKPDRLQGAKLVIGKLARFLWSDAEARGKYPLALIPFRGNAVPLYAPFTIEQLSFLGPLGHANENTVTAAGTSLLAALRAYKELLLKYPQKTDRES